MNDKDIQKSVDEYDRDDKLTFFTKKTSELLDNFLFAFVEMILNECRANGIKFKPYEGEQAIKALDIRISSRMKKTSPNSSYTNKLQISDFHIYGKGMVREPVAPRALNANYLKNRLKLLGYNENLLSHEGTIYLLGLIQLLFVRIINSTLTNLHGLSTVSITKKVLKDNLRDDPLMQCIYDLLPKKTWNSR